MTATDTVARIDADTDGPETGASITSDVADPFSNRPRMSIALFSRKRVRRDNRTWPVEGLIHPGLTCISAPPEFGKTTLLKTLAVAIATGAEEWLGARINLEAGKSVLFGFENGNDADEFEDWLAKRGLAERIWVFPTGRLTEAGRKNLDPAMLQSDNVGLVLLDSARKLAGNLNDQDRAELVIDILESADVPIVIIHHPRGGHSNGRPHNDGPAGCAAYRQAYRQLWIVRSHKKVGPNLQVLELEGAGNDDGGEKTRLRVQVDYESLSARRVDTGAQAAENDQAIGADWQAYRVGLARLADQRGFEFGLNHNEFATALFGASKRQSEDPAWKTSTAAAQMREMARVVFDKDTITYAYVVKIVRANGGPAGIDALRQQLPIATQL